MIFYAIFPVLLLLIKTPRQALIFLLISIVVSCALRSALHFQYMKANPSARYDWSYFSFASNMCFFAMGIYAYLLSEFYKTHTKSLSVIASLVAIVIICALLFTNVGYLIKNTARFDIVLWGIGLTALCIWQALRPSFIMASYVFEYLGERSFSIYMIHPVAIFYLKPYLQKIYQLCMPVMGNYSYFISASLLLVVILCVAEFTYRFIEVQGIGFGRKLIARRKTI